MSKPKPYISRASTLQDALAAVGRLPGVMTAAIQQWGEIEIVVRKREPKRSLDQNRLQRLWCREVRDQSDMSAEEWRGYCKYHFGVAILCEESEDYREACKAVLSPLTYEQRLLLMQEPHDYPVTRGMTKAQKTKYLNRIWEHFTGQGFRLTDPGLKGIGPDQYREVAA
ncbi:hypothetical protein [Halomonas caseinilytica]|uniref:hypothetical protein n=1 Tax=Halomonas caseinilytica TaxID=438744 RepID=UPI000848C871|nr:hypothetical protein [Halomonas caseinilytica]